MMKLILLLCGLATVSAFEPYFQVASLSGNSGYGEDSSDDSSPVVDTAKLAMPEAGLVDSKEYSDEDASALSDPSEQETNRQPIKEPPLKRDLPVEYTRKVLQEPPLKRALPVEYTRKVLQEPPLKRALPVEYTRKVLQEPPLKRSLPVEYTRKVLQEPPLKRSLPVEYTRKVLQEPPLKRSVKRNVPVIYSRVPLQEPPLKRFFSLDDTMGLFRWQRR